MYGSPSMRGGGGSSAGGSSLSHASAFLHTSSLESRLRSIAPILEDTETDEDFMAQSDDDGTKRDQRKWTPEEDDLLRSLVQKLGLKHWNRVAQYLPERTGKQCR
jgi:hypothetical protein